MALVVQDNLLAQVLDTHFDPSWGSPYWLERAKHLGFEPRTEIQGLADLHRFGPMGLDGLSLYPIEHFIPRRYHQEIDRFILSETGGTTGPAKRTAFLADEFQAGFVTPFVRAAEHIGFPCGERWLYLGPTGPHIVGKAVRECALALGSPEPFCVDFDPRWVRKLTPGSMARRRYTEHIYEQATAILNSQNIGVLFGTPPLLTLLGERLEASIRESIVGVHQGGMAADSEFWKRLREHFPRAVVMGGYGNSLVGMCPQLEVEGESPAYFSHGARMHYYFHNIQENGEGVVAFHRLDESCLLVNVIERDVARLVTAPMWATDEGFQQLGLLDPRPPVAQPTLQEGLY